MASAVEPFATMSPVFRRVPIRYEWLRGRSPADTSSKSPQLL